MKATTRQMLEYFRDAAPADRPLRALYWQARRATLGHSETRRLLLKNMSRPKFTAIIARSYP